MSEAKKQVKVTQIGSPIGRPDYQRQTLIGLGLNKRHRSRVLEQYPLGARHDRQGGPSRGGGGGGLRG